MNKHDLLSFAENFPDEKSCRLYLENKLWNGKPKCPHCTSQRKIYRYANNRTFKCTNCKRQFQVTTGTIYQDSNIPLRKWFLAYYLFSVCKNGISSVELGKNLGISQKAAWYMMQKLRVMVKTKNKVKQLSKIVEVDETYVGGKKKGFGYRGRSSAHKTPVFGILQRNGNVIIMPVPDAKRRTLEPIILRHVVKGSHIMSDEWGSYNHLYRHYTHKRVNHGAWEYVRGNVHTNGIEGVWSLLKRSIRGVYIRPSRKHLDKYCAEFQFKYNTRKDSVYNRFEKVITSSQIVIKQQSITE